MFQFFSNETNSFRKLNNMGRIKNNNKGSCLTCRTRVLFVDIEFRVRAKIKQSMLQHKLSSYLIHLTHVTLSMMWKKQEKRGWLIRTKSLLSD